MNQRERLDYLLNQLAEEYSNVDIPESYDEKRHLLRALMNVRKANPLDKKWLYIQDDFLKQELLESEITDVLSLNGSPKNPNMILWQGDITRLRVDAIVNAANSALLGCFIPNHRCIDNAIHSAAGFQLRLECSDIMKAQAHDEPTGKAKITSAYNLPSKYVIHTVGPIIYSKLTTNDKELLKSCYNSCLNIAAKNGCESIAICCISTGEFHFPNDQASIIAVNTVSEFLANYKGNMKVVFNVFKDLDYSLYKKLLEY